ncbi:substrate-binding domain-containing protein [Halovulum sp. GXIMD14794]
MAALLSDDRTYTVAGRVLAFRDAALAAGLPFEIIAIPRQGYADGRAAITRDWDRLSRCDGLFAATDLIACGALDGLRLDKRVPVPETMQVVGFDDIEQAGWGAYDLSTIRQDVPEQVALAVSAMRARLDHPDAPFTLRNQTLTAVPRGTTRNGPDT